MAVNLSPVGGVAAQFFTNTGAVLTGGKLYTYAAGTTTPATTYTSSNGAIAQPNPVVLDAAGRVPNSGEIWLTDGINYKFVLKDSNDVLIATYDNISGINSNFIAFTNQQEIVTATAGQTVFNLSISYSPGTNSLSVFVDGVNQYGPGAQYAYVETDSDTVTFVSGLHVGAEVKFTTSQLQGGGAVDASQVSYIPPFTGSVATNVEAKLAQTVSVKDFGATGNGTTDDGPAIQLALTAATEVEFPIGTYLVETPIDVPTNTKLVGKGGIVKAGAGIVAPAARSYVFTVNGDSVVFESMIIDVDYDTFTPNPSDEPKVGAIYSDSKNYVSLINCKITGGANKYQSLGWLQTPLIWFVDSVFLSFTNCTVIGSYVVGAPFAKASELCLFEGCANVQINGGIYSNSWYSCIGVGASGTSASERVTIDGVIAEQCSGSVVSFNAIDSVISNCILSYSRNQIGIAMGHPGSISTGCKAIGNTIFKCGRGGIDVSYTEAVVTGNTIYDCQEDSPTDLYAAGIAVGDASGTPTDRRRAVIQGNDIKNCYQGIVVSDSSVAGEDGGDYAIGGNVVSYCTQNGIYSQAPRTVITGNVVKSNGAGINIQTNRAVNSVCSSNTVVDNTGNGIYCDTNINVLIFGNMVYNNGTDIQSSTAGADTFYSSRNFKFNNPSTALTTGDDFFGFEGYSNDASTGGTGISGGIFHEAGDPSGVTSQHRMQVFYVTGGSHTLMDSMKTTPQGLVVQSYWDVGNNYYLWADTSGRLRIKNGAPTSATDGTVVGTQS